MDVEPEHRRTRSATVSEVLTELDRDLSNRRAMRRALPTGFDVLDEVLSGGLHRGELILMGGPPGVGKTIAALQWARNLAAAGVTCVFACYEHERETLLTRLIALEAGGAGNDRPLAKTIQRAIDDGADGTTLAELLATTEHGSGALARIQEYAERLILVRASGSHTTIDELTQLIEEHRQPDEPCVLFVDYLQKIPLHPEPATEGEKVTRTVEALKDLALNEDLPVVLLSAVDAEGMRANRLRMYHLRGSSAIAFESDVVVMMNDKQKAVAKMHLTYDQNRARGYKDWVVFSIEKNRGGPTLVDLEFRKDFRNFRFDPVGGIVEEQLVSERLDDV